ncbi:MAG: cryptochrome/photolyase family protein [Rhodothermales bacterium]|nr:cryptochrome/photolyase family protein [Rhodothermales bacterium]
MSFSGFSLTGSVRRLLVVLGDQLDHDSPLVADLDLEQDAILMMEVEEESLHVATHFQRSVYFLAAMRHFAGWLDQNGHRVEYTCLDDDENTQSFESEVTRALRRLAPDQVEVCRPGSRRVLAQLRRAAGEAGLELTVLEDPHFLSSPEDFADWARGRKTLTMEYFYREMRKRLGILVDGNGKPEGGSWNYDSENRNALKAAPEAPAPWQPGEDLITDAVMELVADRLPSLPGRQSPPRWPVTREGALAQLDRFVAEALPEFGRWQDAMWTGDSLLWHSHLSPALNVKLLNPREVVQAAVDAYSKGDAPLNSVEGFVRQVIGWREFMRGIYWTQDDSYRDANNLEAGLPLADAYWSGSSPMACVRESVTPVLEMGYSHHIQRLMVTGNLALTAGMDPAAVRDWYLGMFVDGIDWVTTPNVIGMALYADGGTVATKPYAAGGAYMNRMSNYCGSCAFNPKKRTGESACPLSTLYWDFLIRNRERFAGNHRMGMMLKNVDRMNADTVASITDRAEEVRREIL